MSEVIQNIISEFRMARSGLRGVLSGVKEGAIDPMSAIWMVVTIGVSLIIGILLMGRFTAIAQEGSFGLSETWTTILNGTADILGSSLSLSGILPFAIIGAAAMSVVGWAFISRR